MTGRRGADLTVAEQAGAVHHVVALGVIFSGQRRPGPAVAAATSSNDDLGNTSDFVRRVRAAECCVIGGSA